MLALKNAENKIEYPRNWVPMLRSLVLEMQSAEIRTVEALCVALAQDDTDAGRVMAMLLEFLPRSIRVDGAIWKSDRYWWTDHRINYRKMVRARRNFNPIVSSWKQKAQGAPTWHYQLDGESMVLGLSRTLDCSTAYMKALILQNQNDENGAKTAKNAKSITLDSDSDSESDLLNSKSKIVTEVELALAAEGMTLKTAGEFAAMNILTVRRVIDVVRGYETAGKIRKSKAAVLVTALRREMGSITPPPSPLPISQAHGEEEQEKDEYTGSGRLPDVKAAVSRVDELESQVDEKHRRVWDMAKDQLRVQLDPTTFNTWLSDVRVIGVEDGAFVLAVRNERALEFCRGRLHKSVRNMVRICSGSDSDVRFETPPLTPPRIQGGE